MAAFITSDVRARIIQAYQSERGTYQCLADIFGVGIATVNRVLRRYREAGDHRMAPRKGGRKAKIGLGHAKEVAKMVQLMPDATFDEYTVYWRQNHSKDISRASIVRGLQRLGYTRKKDCLCYRAAARRRKKEDQKLFAKHQTHTTEEFGFSRRSRLPGACEAYSCSSQTRTCCRLPSF